YQTNSKLKTQTSKPMLSDSSIKWRPIWKVWIPIALFLIPLILEGQLIGTIFTPYIYGLLVLIYGLVYYFRTKLWQAFVLMTVMCIAICWYFLAERPGQTIETFELIGFSPDPGLLPWIKSYITIQLWLAILITNFVIFYTLGPVLTKALALEKNAIRLFRLSARQVHDERNGYTERPFNAGKHNYKRDELYSFTSYLETKKVCIALFPGNGIKYLFSMGTSPLLKSKQDKLSHVFFGDNGDMSIFISKEDYRQYRKQYTFDQLCEMMGKTFLRFAEYHKLNNEQRIITELKSV
ncbi:MAG: hypothetical protein ABFS05_02835, partial [Bacteroidota bacterium]